MKKIFRNIVLLFFTSITLVSCGKTIASINLLKEQSEVEVEMLKGEELQIWNSIDIKYDSNGSIKYKIQISSDGQIYFDKVIEGLKPDIKIGSSEITLNNRHSISWNNGRLLSGIKMNNNAKLKITVELVNIGEIKEINRNVIIIKK